MILDFEYYDFGFSCEGGYEVSRNGCKEVYAKVAKMFLAKDAKRFTQRAQR